MSTDSMDTQLPDPSMQSTTSLPTEQPDLASTTIAEITTTPKTNTSKVKVAEPDTFDGTPSLFRDWSRQIVVFLKARKVIDDSDKILTTLSYMKKGNAAIWAQQYVDRYIQSPTMGTWEEFTNALFARFGDRTHARKVREKLEHFPQGRITIDEYMNRFESMTADAGLDEVENEKIRLLEKGTKPTIIKAIYSSGNLPTGFNSWRDRVLIVGRLLEELDEKERHTTTFTQPKHVPTHTSAPIPEKHTGTGVVYGGGGKPMDLTKMREENRCFRCGEKGHFGRDCPEKKKFNIRALLTELDDEEMNELKEELNPKEKDFVDGR
jgi:hypothetical protein